MIHVKVKPGEDFNRAFRRFKRAVENEGIMRELKKRQYYLKPSAAKKAKRKLAAKRRRKAEVRLIKRK
jgi:small subunit ribosomal protein S21